MNDMLKDQLLNNEFELDIPLSKQTYFYLERKIGSAFFNSKPPIVDKDNLLNLGCGTLIYDGWINADDFAFKRALQEKKFRPNWRLDIGKTWNCNDNHWDGIFTQHVIEHLPYSSAVFVLGECFRTLNSGAWLRLSVPDLRKYVDFYEGKSIDEFFQPFQQKALAISFLTQMHTHRSTWDVNLMIQLLTEIGFVQSKEVEFGEGTDHRLIKDQESKAVESLYIEAQKPN